MGREAKKPEPGVSVEIEPGIRRIVAPNPGPMTHWGTNTYLIGHDPILVIDPGPASDAHLSAVLAALGSAKVKGIAVTHAHLDHSAMAQALAHQTGAPILGFGPPEAGRSALMERFAKDGGIGGGEGRDAALHPDILLADGDRVADTDLRALHTPGHFGGHLSFQIDDIVLTGDVVMGWSTTLISPPDGDVRDFLNSAWRLASLGARRLLPGHGQPVEDPGDRLIWLIKHRLARETQVLEALGRAPGTAKDVARLIYADLPEGLLPAATRNTLAHLLDLWDREHIAPGDGPLDHAVWAFLPKS
ncbi:MAG: MBL fold metallo-hydrolase [Pseudomonadota bacterium]